MPNHGPGAVVLLARSWRGPVVEAEHYGQVALATPEGFLYGAAGDPDTRVVLRSAAKPLQALAVVTSGARERFGLSPRDLAICCGSHSGSAEHVAVVREILAKLGRTEADLDCGTHAPGDEAERVRLIRAGLEPGPLHSNCSGKHAGMLATALALGLDPAGYTEPAHPLQAVIRSHLAAISSVAEADLHPLPDGCGAPTYALPLAAIATAFARLTQPLGLPPALQDAAHEITAAMLAHPEMVQASGGFNTELMRAAAGRVVAKGGAEGLFALGLPGEALGLAIKVSDGAARPWPVVVADVLALLTDWPAERLRGFVREEQRNCHGQAVGFLEAAPELGEALAATREEMVP